MSAGGLRVLNCGRDGLFDGQMLCDLDFLDAVVIDLCYQHVEWACGDAFAAFRYAAELLHDPAADGSAYA